jgi:hypothetical protein
LDASDALTLSNFRFAVGSFDSWLQLLGCLDELGRKGFPFQNFNCLALQRVFVGRTFASQMQMPVPIKELAFPEGLVCCSAGLLHDCLCRRLAEGAGSLEDALSCWLVPRHAEYFQRVVENGKIQLWIRLLDAADERRAYRSLLASSSNSVGVHDLAVRPCSSVVLN